MSFLSRMGNRITADRLFKDGKDAEATALLAETAAELIGKVADRAIRARKRGKLVEIDTRDIYMSGIRHHAYDLTLAKPAIFESFEQLEDRCRRAGVSMQINVIDSYADSDFCNPTRVTCSFKPAP